MKKLLLIPFLFAAICGCNSKSTDESNESFDAQSATNQELQEAIANRDSLLMLVNQISDGLDQIKAMENILSSPSAENPSVRENVLAQIAEIQATLAKRQEQLENLENRLKRSNQANAELKKTIQTLRDQIESQTNEIASLKQSLSDANLQIDELSGTVSHLNEVVDTVTNQRDAAQLQNRRLEDELNTCFYVIASSKELKDHNILESGFLKKTKVMEGDFDKSFFTKANKQTLRSINLYSKKAKVLTKQPENSYELQKNADGTLVLRILDPQAFWAISNYLVVEIN